MFEPHFDWREQRSGWMPWKVKKVFFFDDPRCVDINLLEEIWILIEMIMSLMEYIHPYSFIMSLAKQMK